MSTNNLIVDTNGSLPMTVLTADSDDHPAAHTNHGGLEPRKRKLTEISLGSNEGKNSDTDDEKREGSNAPKGSKAHKLKDAIMSGDVSAVQSLLDQKIDVNISDSFGRSGLHNAVLKGVPRIVDMILSANADVNVKDDREDSPLHYTARTGNPEILKLLLSKPDCDVNMKGSNLNSPLHLAASLNQPELCKLMLEHHANPNIQEENGKTPLGRAVESGANHSARCLFEYMKSLGMSMEDILYNCDFDGTTLLHLAVDSGFTEVVKLCLENGARIRQPRRKDRATAFHLACEQGSSSIVELLVQCDPGIAKILLINADGLTPLHQAAASNSCGIAEILIEQGSNVNARSNDNRTPLMLAAERGSTDTVRLLLDKGADPTLKDVDNRTAVFDAVGSVSSMELILQDPALAPILTEKDLAGYSAAHYAAKRGDAKSMALFLQHNKSTSSVVSDTLDTPLHVAAKYGCHEVIRVILGKQSGKIINAQNSRSRTALHLACSGGHYKAAILLLENGAIIEKDQNGRTALHEAAQKGAKKVVEMVVEKHSFCLNYTDDDKNTALHLAVQNSHTEITDMLLSLRKQEILINATNQNILDLAVELDSPNGAMAIAKHHRWREVLDSCTNGISKMIKKLLVKMPSVAERIFDNCIVSEGDKSSEHFRMKFDFGVILRKSDPQQKSSMEILNVVANDRIESSLCHKLTFAVLSTKWNSYGWLAFMGNILSILVYIIPLTVLHVVLENEDKKYCHDLIRTSPNGHPIYLMLTGKCHRDHLDMQVLQYVVAVIVILQLMKEVFECVRKGPIHYFSAPTNLIELTALLSAIVSILPTCECKWGYQKQSAATSLFFGWINMIMYLQGLPFYGKYVIMLYTMFITLIKVMALFILFALAFGSTFHLIIDQDPFTSLGNIMMNMFIMMLGEINYVDVFMPWNKLYYPFMVNLVLVLFCLTMPIILMNMLVGLSVGDIDAIEQRALIDRYVLQINLLTQLEEAFPKWLLRRVQKTAYIYYPNKTPSIGIRIFNLLIGFGEVDSEDLDVGDGGKLESQVNEMHEKLEEQSHTIDEMKTTIVSMFDMMKRAEAERELQKSKEKAKPKRATNAANLGGLGVLSTSLTGSLPLSGLSFGFGSKKPEESTTDETA